MLSKTFLGKCIDKLMQKFQTCFFFSFYYEGQQQQSEFNSIKSKLLLLRQDQVVRGLEPVYGEFLKNKKYHPSEFLEQCILSLL